MLLWGLYKRRYILPPPLRSTRTSTNVPDDAINAIGNTEKGKEDDSTDGLELWRANEL